MVVAMFCIQTKKEPLTNGSFFVTATTQSSLREEVESLIQGITNCSGTIFIFTKYLYSSLIDMIANRNHMVVAAKG